MIHACACCHLRFVNASELADHVRADHTEHPPLVEGQERILRHRREPLSADQRTAQVVRLPW